MSFLVESLTRSAKIRTMAPMSQSTFLESDLIQMADDELLLKLVSDIRRIREDFFLSTKRVPIVAGVTHYTIPERAIGTSFDCLHYVDVNGQICGPALVRIDVERKGELIRGDSLRKFYIEGDEVVIAEPTASQGWLEFSYPRKPNRLVATSACAKITHITENADFIEFDVDTDLTVDLPVGSAVDFLSVRSPFLLWAEDSVTTGVSSTQIQVARADVVNRAGVIEPKVGDYICPAGHANVPMIPEEFHPVLAQMVAVRILASLGHTEKYNVAKNDLKEVRLEALTLIKNRVSAAPKRPSGRNGLLAAFNGK